jgi:hypothetical protein
MAIVSMLSLSWPVILMPRILPMGAPEMLTLTPSESGAETTGVPAHDTVFPPA